MVKKILLGAVLLSLFGCVSLNSVSLTQLPSDHSMPISAHGSDWAVLGYSLSNVFVDQAIDRIRDQCHYGRIEGILTKYQTTTYLLFYKESLR